MGPVVPRQRQRQLVRNPPAFAARRGGAARLGVRDMRGKELDRDGPMKLGIEGDDHDAHPTLADHVLQPVRAEEHAGLDAAAEA